MTQGESLAVDDKVNWLYEARRGYGYVASVAGVVTKIGTIRMQRKGVKKG